jgi:hypothetical protein|tara:strand:+ start:3451 stop:5358 length:1908 start_codon:yes stop_codon:yes gene_type:complete
MAKGTKSERYEKVHDRLRLAQRWREDEGYDMKWRRMIDLYRGKTYWGDRDGWTSALKTDRISVNLAFSTINVIGPAVSVNNPKITVSANKESDADRAVFVEAVVNYLWRHFDYRKPFRRAVKDFLIIGHAWVKVGWKFVEEERQLASYEIDDEVARSIQEIDEFAMENPAFAGDLPSDNDVISSIPTSEMVVLEDQPFVERISPFDMFVDPEATCLDDAKWIAQRIVRPLSEVKKDKRFKGSVRRNLQADSGLKVRWENDTERDDYADHVDRVTLYEFYDLESNTISVCAHEADDYLLDPTPMPYAFGHPFVMMRNYDIPDIFYPMGDLDQIESLQEELNKTRTQMTNHRKRYARKYLYHERSFGPEGREALESDDDGRFVPVIDENRDLNSVVTPLPQVPLAPEIYQQSGIIEQDINTVSGVSEYSRGQMPEVRRTATEASIIADAGNARSADKLATVEIVIGDVARRILQLMQQYMTAPQMVRIQGRDAEQYYVAYTRDDILGEYDFSVEGGSTQPLNETARRQQAISLMNAVAPLVGSVIDPNELARYVLQFGFGVKNPDKFIMQQAPAPEGGPPPEGGAPPEGDPGMQPPPMSGGMGPGPVPNQVFEATGGVPPELLSQLQNQMGVELPNL